MAANSSPLPCHSSWCGAGAIGNNEVLQPVRQGDDPGLGFVFSQKRVPSFYSSPPFPAAFFPVLAEISFLKVVSNVAAHFLLGHQGWAARFEASFIPRTSHSYSNFNPLLLPAGAIHHANRITVARLFVAEYICAGRLLSRQRRVDCFICF